MADSQSFGRFELRTAQREVLIDGKPVALGARAFDVLVVLVERRERLVTKDELFDLVWPGLAVGDNNLVVQVGTLRRLLGADMVATIPGRGYRFVAPSAPPLDGTAVPEPAQSAARALPPPFTPLVGRDADAAAVDLLLSQHRLVTLTGAGGVGKTSLAQRLLHERLDRYPDGGVWVELAGLSDPALVTGAVARALGLQMGAGEPLAALISCLGPLRILVVLDNAEHLVEEVARVADGLLAVCPGVRLMITSQVPLSLTQEQVVWLEPLAVPDADVRPEHALRYGAVELLLRHVQGAERAFVLDEHNVAAVTDICRQLDGLPLALQLAAARLPVLGASALAASLGDRLRLLRSGQSLAPARQQTLRAALEWSHRLLSDTEQVVLRRLSVFVGGFSMELAQQVVPEPEPGNDLDQWEVLDVLGALIDRSLVVVDHADPPRYRLLETTRFFALEQLAAAAEEDAVRDRHAQAVLAYFEQLWSARLTGRRLVDDGRRALTRELDNGRAAFSWALGHARTVALALAPHLSYVLSGTSRPDALQAYEVTESDLGDDVPLNVRAKWALGLSRHWQTWKPELAVRWGLAAADWYRESGDPTGLYLSLCAICTSHGASVGAAQRHSLAELLSLEVPGWSAHLRSQAARAEALIARIDGDYERAIAAYQRVLTLCEASGDSFEVLFALLSMADIELMTGQTEAAIRHGEQIVVRLGTERNHLYMALALLNLTAALLFASQVKRARQVASEGWQLSAQFLLQAPWSDYLALLAAQEDRVRDAAQLLGCADVFYAGNLRQTNEVRAVAEVERIARHRLGDAEFDRLRAQGRALQHGDVDVMTFGPTPAAANAG